MELKLCKDKGAGKKGVKVHENEVELSPTVLEGVS